MLDIKFPAVGVVDKFRNHPADATAGLQVKEERFELCFSLSVIRSDAAKDNLVKSGAYTILAVIGLF